MDAVVLPECPASRHNTITAARGNAHRPPYGGPRCICPKAVELYERYLERERARPRSESQIVKLPQYMRNVKRFAGVPDPDWRRGACSTPEGRQRLDSLSDVERNPPATVRAAVKRMCHGCPIVEQCYTWILAKEDPGGSWGGYYAGLSPTERRRIWDENHPKAS